MQTETPLERLQVLLPDVFNPKPQTGDLYLRFYLSSSLYAAIPLNRIVETLRISATSITPIPNMPAYILGLTGNRSNVFWILDLAQRLALPQTAKRLRHYNIIVVELLGMTQPETKKLWLGFTTQQIQNTLRLQPEELNFEVSNIMPELQPYLQGWFQHQGEKTLLLNIDAIAQADYSDR
ncbi:chemotaxis signal transduction protein [Leptolyngbya sp. Heron Island J]|uniref:chemotaxis protein CheW n=1 Tax=Leptolyngbya sp. Heron Island J TaxID=1385935 RepID=UPI0003B9D907|nr:chemotaxis protein CheW [Leptolyngbya sp. Heron Island J]ESA32818.1 chemotaxis signal transduction protein [Leptolyngbya sp. Heron Island J]